jgi:hypothetical protein
MNFIESIAETIVSDQQSEWLPRKVLGYSTQFAIEWLVSALLAFPFAIAAAVVLILVYPSAPGSIITFVWIGAVVLIYYQIHDQLLKQYVEDEASDDEQVGYANFAKEGSSLSPLDDLNDEVRLFVDDLQSQYRNVSKLSSICSLDIKRSRHELLDNREYYQIGKKEKFPIDIIRDGMWQSVTTSMARQIAKGEERMLLKHLEAKALDGEIEVLDEPDGSLESLNDAIREAVNIVENPDHIFMPMTDEYWNLYEDWFDSLSIQFEEVGSDGQVTIGDENLTITMVHPSLGIKDTYIYNSGSVSVFQKTGDISDDPIMEWDEKFEDLNRNQLLMAFFGTELNIDKEDENYQEKIDLLYRVVVSEPELSGYSSAVQIPTPDGIAVKMKDDGPDYGNVE